MSADEREGTEGVRDEDDSGSFVGRDDGRVLLGIHSRRTNVKVLTCLAADRGDNDEMGHSFLFAIFFFSGASARAAE